MVSKRSLKKVFEKTVCQGNHVHEKQSTGFLTVPALHLHGEAGFKPQTIKSMLVMAASWVVTQGLCIKAIIQATGPPKPVQLETNCTKYLESQPRDCRPDI